jgi:hypothetical protein
MPISFRSAVLVGVVKCRIVRVGREKIAGGRIFRPQPMAGKYAEKRF